MRSIFALAALAASVIAQAETNLTAALSGTPELSELTKLVSGFPELLATLGNATNITILAPSNDAISKFANSSSASALADPAIIQAVLSYHVLNGTINSTQITEAPSFVATLLTSSNFTNVTGGQRVEAVNNSGTVSIITGYLEVSNVTKADIAYNNGIVHIIDTILTVPGSISDTATEFELSAVAGALTKADLVEAVDDLPDVTVFVPNNEAFAAIASVLANATAKDIAAVLSYHVVNGTVLYSSDAANTTVPSLAGPDLTVTVANGSIFINQAKVVTPNILVANGVVHVIDSVLNPNNTSVAPGTNGTAFPGASSSSDVPFTSGVPTPTGSASVPPVASASVTGSSSGNAAGHFALPTGLVGAGALVAGALMAL